MNSHKNARLTALGRAELVRRVLDEGQSVTDVGAALGVCVKTVRKWVARLIAEGAAGLADRPSRPHKLYRPTPDAVVERIAALRRERWTGKHIAAELGVSPATVSRVLRRLPEWTHSYNWHRPHGGIGSQRPISRLGMNGDNLLRLHSYM